MLAEIIKQEISQRGPIPFRDFMEKCLYYPGLGYYTSPKIQIGKTGDFYTSPSVSPAFGAMIAKQLKQMWDIMGVETFTIVEFGAGNGWLCHDILDYFKDHSEVYDKLSYCIIEKSDVMRRRQQQHLVEKLSWVEGLSELGTIKGCILSNELLDNFAVHLVEMESELMEVFVGYGMIS